MEFKKREIIFGYAIGGFFLIWLVVKVILVPFQQKLSGLNGEVILREARLKKGVSLIEKKDEIEKEYGKYASYFSMQDFSDEEAVANFLKEVEKISRDAGLVILDMKPQKDAKGDKFSKQYQINIKAEASMQKLVTFLYALHNSSVLFSVEKLVLVPKAEDSPELNITMTVVGVSFV
ncbi:MAG: GspMb/PilO family protein [Candidatus Omnitrophota bacterium]